MPLDIEDFDRLLHDARGARPSFFATDPDERQCSVEEIVALEARLGVQLPNEYKQYLQRYGGGYIGNINVFTACADSPWYLPTASRLLPKESNFIAITDDQCGGYYGFVVSEGTCSQRVYYWYPMEADPLSLAAESFLLYVASVGLEQES